MSRPLARCLTAFVLPFTFAACGDRGPEGASGEWRAQIDTIGDTVVVRTLGGSEWGTAELVPELRIGALEGAEHETFGDIAGFAVSPDGRIYVYDRQVPALRSYGPDGSYLGTLGRRGGGPGEYDNSDGGIAVLADGRIVLRDPGNGRFTVWAPDGTFLESWPARGNMFTSTPLFPAADGGFHNPVFGSGEPMRLVVHDPAGAPGDTLGLPDRGVDPPSLTAQSEQMMQRMTVPFAPRAVWAWHPDGYYASAVTSRYEIDLLRPDDAVLRIARAVEPVAVEREERSVEEDRITRTMRRIDASWRWDGPAIPPTKPFIREVYAGQDGRIWVQLHQPGVRVEDPDAEPGPDGRPLAPRYTEPVAFDVFEDDGRFLGRVHAPEGFAVFPQPTFRGDHVWAIERDDFGVQTVVRYRIAREGEHTG